MAKIVVFGIGDAGRMAHYYFRHDSDHEVVAFTVDAEYVKESHFLGLPLVEFAEMSELYAPSAYKMFVAVGYSKMNQVRAAKYFAAKKMGYELVSYVSSNCTYLSETPTGDNCFILEGNAIQPFVRIVSNVTIWSGGHIGHDTVIGDHCFCAPRVAVSGRVHIGSYCFIGLNATVRNGVHIASRSLVGSRARL